MSTIASCRACGSAFLWRFLDLGNQALPRFPANPKDQIPHAPLALIKCELCGLVQLSESVDRDLLFKQFWYRSGVSTSISSDLKIIAEEGAKEAGYEGIALDIGCNDGTLLKNIPDGMPRIGFEPAENLATLAENYGHIIPDYFNPETYLSKFGKAKLVTAIAMFYDLQNPARFCRDVSDVLSKDGVFIVQQNYLGSMIQNTAYDNVCHEHLTYFSLLTLKMVLQQVNLEVYRVVLNQVNGGSFKTFIAHRGMRKIEDSVRLLEQAEKESGLDSIGRRIFRDFSYRVRANARQLNRFLDGKKNVMIYGAGTRGATLLQYSKVGHVDAAVDNNPEKHGRYYLDTGIPIISREEAVENPPDYFLVLPYHLADEIVNGEKSTFPNTRWVIPLPEFRVL